MSKPIGANKTHYAELYWIPLGAGNRIVQISGKIFEAISAFLQRRDRQNLFHAALLVHTPDGVYSIEQAPVVNKLPTSRGVVTTGPVGMKWLGRSKFFRYEVRCWKNGIIPDLEWAEGGPVKVIDSKDRAENVLMQIRSVPNLVWGRDELNNGEMWNSNSVISWTLIQSGVNASRLMPPGNGRAPGWNTGIAATLSTQAELVKQV